MKRLLLMFGLMAGVAHGQSLGYTPPAYGAYIYAAGSWSPWTSASGSNQIPYTPYAIGMYCFSSGAWSPCAFTGTGANTYTGAQSAPQFINTTSSPVTATPGTSVTSVTCATATCTTQRGTYTIVGGTATTGTIATLAWPNTGTAWVCTATMNGGTGFLGIGNSVATTTGMNITAGVAVTGLTVIVNYSCQP